jgi:hypothetical protein
VKAQQHSVNSSDKKIECIGRGMQLFGAYKNEEAKEYVGKLDWKIVQNNAGWQEI